MQIGKKDFDVKNRTYVMGILNITPDSFSDGGQWQDKDIILKRVEQMVEEGAEILDIGGESTRPGYEQISDLEEILRITPVIESVKTRFDIPISVDTYKSGVARAALEAGADMINDIWGLTYDEEMAGVIAKANVPCCLMHNRKDPTYSNFMQEVAADLARSIYLAERAGIDDYKIILDPGVGFAKNYEQNLEVMNRLEELHVFGYPLLLGASRKSVIGLTLDLPVEERVEGTLATSVIAAVKGCAFVRVHDVKENVRALRMAEAILRR